MSTINSIGIDSSLLTNNLASAAKQTSSVSNSTTVASESSSANTANQDKVEISTRAQKIQKLNEEFFSGPIDQFTITQNFIQRLEEYGLITAEQASELAVNTEASDSSESSTVGELSNFIDSFTASVKTIDPNSSLIGVLQQAKTVLDDFNNPTEKSKNINIVQISRQIQSYIDSASEQLPETDTKSLNELVSALDIANLLTPGKNTTSQINSYLAINNL